MKKSLTIILLCALVALSACGPGQPSLQGRSGSPNPPFQGEEPQDAYVNSAVPGVYGGELVMTLISNPKSFNPILSSESSTNHVVGGPVYRTLIDYDNERAEDVPSLAKSWESTPDGLTWTFNLRKGVKWSDGAPFTADDVIFTYQVTFDPDIPAPSRDAFLQTDGSLPTFEKVDDYTVRFQLKEPNALFLASHNSVYLLPKHKWEGAYRAGKFQQVLLVNSDPSDIVGLGPYRVLSFTSDQQVVLERNPYYWKKDRSGQRLPYIDRVRYLIVPDRNTEVLKFQNGETDTIHSVNPDGASLLRRNQQQGDYTLYDLGPSYNVTYVVLNQDLDKYKDRVKLNWFRNVKFRQAVSHGIDREAIIRTAYQGEGVAVYGFDSPANKVWYTDNKPKFEHNPERARQLLKEIGIEDRNGDGIAEDAEGHPIKFSLITNSNNEIRKNTGVAIKDSLSKIGIDINFQPIDFNLLHSKLQTTRDFDAAIGTWQSGFPPDPIQTKNVIMPTASQYYAFPNQKVPGTDWEKRLVELINKVSSTNDLSQRQQAYWEAMRIWSENLPQIDLAVSKYFCGAKNRFGNFKPSPLALFTYWNLDELYFTK